MIYPLIEKYFQSQQIKRKSKFVLKYFCIPVFLCFLIKYSLRKKSNINLAENPIEKNNDNDVLNNTTEKSNVNLAENPIEKNNDNDVFLNNTKEESNVNLAKNLKEKNKKNISKELRIRKHLLGKNLITEVFYDEYYKNKIEKYREIVAESIEKSNNTEYIVDKNLIKKIRELSLDFIQDDHSIVKSEKFIKKDGEFELWERIIKSFYVELFAKENKQGQYGTENAFTQEFKEYFYLVPDDFSKFKKVYYKIKAKEFKDNSLNQEEFLEKFFAKYSSFKEKHYDKIPRMSRGVRDKEHSVETILLNKQYILIALDIIKNTQNMEQLNIDSKIKEYIKKKYIKELNIEESNIKEQCIKEIYIREKYLEKQDRAKKSLARLIYNDLIKWENFKDLK